MESDRIKLTNLSSKELTRLKKKKKKRARQRHLFYTMLSEATNRTRMSFLPLISAFTNSSVIQQMLFNTYYELEVH